MLGCIWQQNGLGEIVKNRQNYKMVGLCKNEKRNVRKAVDCDLSTKSCDIAGLPDLEFDLGKAETLTGWKVVNAGKEKWIFHYEPVFPYGKKLSTKTGKQWILFYVTAAM